MPAKKTTKKTKGKAKMNPGENSISKHKTTPTRMEPPAAASPVFDIIPRTRVRPSASSRPVITGTQPAVADTTLRQPAGPKLDLEQPNLDPKPAKKSVAPEEKGVLVADLMAKKQAEAAQPAELAKEEPRAESAPAAAETDPAKPAESTMVHEKVIEPPTTDAEPAVPSEKSAEAAATKPAEAVPDDSLEAVLRDDKPQEQSDELKDAIKESEVDLRHHELYEGKPVIVVHKHHGGKHPALTWVLLFVVCLALALLAVNFLLDAEVISTDYVIPHTDLL